jgi:DNA-binding transcriptional LysR family regulator
MELKHLRYFVAVAEELHFGRAARRLNLAQPALSRRIQDLEAALGVVLLERSPRSVRLTAAGDLYLEEARQILDRLEAANGAVRRLASAGRENGGRRRLLRLGHATLQSSGARLLASVLEALRQADPGLVVDLHLMSTAEQQGALLAGRLDLGLGCITMEAGTPAEELAAERVVDDPFLAARLGRTNPRAGASALPIRLLSDEPILMFHRARNPALHDAILARLRAAGCSGQVIERADHAAGNWDVVPRERGWVLAPRSDLGVMHPDWVCIGLVDFEMPFGIDMIWRPRDTPEIRPVLDLVRASAAPSPTSRPIPGPTPGIEQRRKGWGAACTPQPAQA